MAPDLFQDHLTPLQWRWAMFCKEASLVKYDSSITVATPLYCRSWGCDECQPTRKHQLVALAASGRPTSFITLTVRPDVIRSRSSRARALVAAWRVVVRRAKKKYGYRSIPYLAVFEATKAGEPHLHILARVRWIDQRWLSSQMRALIDAPVVDIRRVKGQRMISSYIAKYVGKEPGKFGTCKRYWRTRDYQLDFPRPHDDWPFPGVPWAVVKFSIAQLMETARRHGDHANWDGEYLWIKIRDGPHQYRL